MTNTVEYQQLEGFMYDNHITRNEVVVSFKTRNHGILQVAYNGNGVSEIDGEPSLQMFTKEEQKYIKEICCIVYRIIFESPTTTERFK